MLAFRLARFRLAPCAALPTPESTDDTSAARTVLSCPDPDSDPARASSSPPGPTYPRSFVSAPGSRRESSTRSTEAAACKGVILSSSSSISPDPLLSSWSSSSPSLPSSPLPLSPAPRSPLLPILPPMAFLSHLRSYCRLTIPPMLTAPFRPDPLPPRRFSDPSNRSLPSDPS